MNARLAILAFSGGCASVAFTAAAITRATPGAVGLGVALPAMVVAIVGFLAAIRMPPPAVSSGCESCGCLADASSSFCVGCGHLR